MVKEKECLNCGKSFNAKDYRQKFCGMSCAATFNNKGINRNPKSDNKICHVCGGNKHKDAKTCRRCYNKQKCLLQDKTLGYFISNQKYLTSKCGEIRKHAKQVLENSNTEKVCVVCKNHEWDEILEIHHIKGILEYEHDTLIKDINNLNNLVWLCPNHHAMIHKKLISL